jgi:ArsR family transcriptional regulator
MVNGFSTYPKRGYTEVTMKKENQFTCDCNVIHEDVVKRVRAVMPEGKVFYDLATLYKMYSDNTRLRILWALSRNSMCVCDLAVLMGMTKSAISHHLKHLRLTNLVKYDKQGKIVYYSLTDDHVKDIFEKGFEHIKE